MLNATTAAASISNTRQRKVFNMIGTEFAHFAFATTYRQTLLALVKQGLIEAGADKDSFRQTPAPVVEPVIEQTVAFIEQTIALGAALNAPVTKAERRRATTPGNFLTLSTGKKVKLVRPVEDEYQVWIKWVRRSPTVGRGSCSPVDECMNDQELVQFCIEADVQSPLGAVRAAVSYHRLWAERMEDCRE